GSLVGATTAQPERPQAEGPPAVPAGRDGHQRAVADGLGRPRQARQGKRRARSGKRRARQAERHPEDRCVTLSNVAHRESPDSAGGRRALPRPATGLSPVRRVVGIAVAVVGLPVVTTVLVQLREHLSLESVLLLYLLAVVLVAVVGGILPGVVAAIVSVPLAHYFLTPP